MQKAIADSQAREGPVWRRNLPSKCCLGDRQNRPEVAGSILVGSDLTQQDNLSRTLSGDAAINWDAIGAIGEIIGALAVVVTLGYLALQVETNTAAVKQASRQATLMGRAEAGRWVAGDPVLSELLWKGSMEPDQLSDREWQRFVLVLQSVFRPVELAYIDYQEGRISPELWEAQHQTIVFWCARPGYRRFLGEYGQTFYPDFVRYIEDTIGALDSA